MRKPNELRTMKARHDYLEDLVYKQRIACEEGNHPKTYWLAGVERCVVCGEEVI